ncbi:MAG: Holliday junction branch migration protein RuvA [Acutalibacteraceae bacterium]
MLYSVRGKLLHTEQSFAVIECGGVGFRCQTTLNTLKSIKLGTEVTLYTYMNVREDAIELFGFATMTELECFKLLISVSGVGPKVGLAVLSVLTPEQTVMAIASNDSKTITRANGVGAKLAQRIILELKDKIKGITSGEGVSFFEDSGVALMSSSNVSKAIEALSVLGYTTADVSPVLSTLDGSLPVERLIAETLKRMGKK